MRKVSGLVFLLLLFFAAPVLAQSVAGTALPTSVPVNTPLTVEEKIQRIELLGTLISDRMQQVINQMEGLHRRIQIVSDKMPLTKSDTANLTTWMATTQTNLDSAQTAVSKFNVDLRSLSASSDYGQLIPELVLETKLAKDALIGAHTALSEVVRRLVELGPTPTPAGKPDLTK